MNIKEYAYEKEFNTPAYFFDLLEFHNCCKLVKQSLGNIPLTYSIKANPFLLYDLPDDIKYVEVCSPGELQICKRNKIDGNRIIYSGVNKDFDDVLDAINYGVDIVTIESNRHLEIVQKVSSEKNIVQKVIIRLTSGNQFGISENDFCNILSHADKYTNIAIYGIHYYSGTQKKSKQIRKDLKKLESFIDSIFGNYKFTPKLVEYGPGLSIDYFSKENNYLTPLTDVLSDIKQFSEKYSLGIEMGRFFAASCGKYATKIKDIKYSDDTNYIICDGGIHHLRYHGQMLAMQIPPLYVLNSNEKECINYCICGSLCTVADVLVADVQLPKCSIGDILIFEKCGAYSVMEGNISFLSRDLPEIYLINRDGQIVKVRKKQNTYKINTAQ